MDHIVEVAFHANIFADERVLRQGGSIATYATGDPNPAVPFWPMVFKNLRLYFLGSDDFPIAAKRGAAEDLSEMLAGGWSGYEVSERFPLDDIALAHAVVEEGPAGGRVVLDLTEGSA